MKKVLDTFYKKNYFKSLEDEIIFKNQELEELLSELTKRDAKFSETEHRLSLQVTLCFLNLFPPFFLRLKRRGVKMKDILRN